MAAYNNYNYGYNNPYGMGYPNYPNNNGFNQQPNYMNNQNQQPQAQLQPQANNYYYVNGIIGAKSFQMQPNQTVLLMDSDNPMCYMKQSNSMGQSSMRYFKLIEISENDLNPNNTVKQTNTNDYVLKSEFNELVKRMDNLSKKFENPVEIKPNSEKGVINNE